MTMPQNLPPFNTNLVLTPVIMFTRNVGQPNMFPASPNVQQHDSAQQ